MTQSALNWSHRQYLPHVWPHVLHGSQWLSLSLNYISITQAALNWSLRQYLPPVLHLFQWLGPLLYCISMTWTVLYQSFRQYLPNSTWVSMTWVKSIFYFNYAGSTMTWPTSILYFNDLDSTKSECDRNLLFLQTWWNFPKFPHLIYRDTSSSLTFYFSEK